MHCAHSQCHENEQPNNENNILECREKSVNDSQIHVFAQKSKRINENQIRLEGNVCLSQDGLALMTPGLNYNQLDGKIITDEKVILQNAQQKISGSVAQLDLQKNTGIVKNIMFEIIDSDVNGSASQAVLRENKSDLSSLTFSTCPLTKRDWEITALTAKLDHNQGMGTFKNTTLRFKNIPLFYIPWIRLPLNDQRRTGFLAPTLSFSDTTGIDFSLPYYWNIAENMDATTTPRLLGQHGLMLENEFRYLTENTTGSLNASFLSNDKKRKRDRGLVSFKNKTQIGTAWIFNTDFNHVSDSRYFEDFSNTSFLTATPYLNSNINISGRSEHWSFYAGVNDYQVLSERITANNEPYQKLPEINFSWFDYNPDYGLNYQINSQLINFYREQSVNAWRLDIMPKIEKSFTKSWGWLKPSIGYRSTYYEFDNDQSSSRHLPIYSIDSGLRFEKKTGTTQAYNTLEPRLFYTYVPERQQNHIPLFDTHELSFGSTLLFQTNRFSGADRQSDMNQIALALTQRSFDDNGTERWNFTFGQIKYFSDQRVQLDNIVKNKSRSPFISEFNYHIRNNWNAAISLHYDEETKKTERALLRIQKKGNNNSVYNLAYRFRKNRIEQLDGSAVLPVNENNRLIARWNYSLQEHKTIEALFGYEYKSCCWAFRLIGRHYLVDENGQSNNGIYAEIQLNGLGSFGRNPRRLLKQSIIGYNEEF